MSKMLKVPNFLKLAVAIITGDDAEAKAIKIQSKAKAAIKAQIAVKQAEILDLEENLQTAKENLEKALANNGNLIDADGKERYITGLFSANEKLERAQKALDATNGDVTFLEIRLEMLD